MVTYRFTAVSYTHLKAKIAYPLIVKPINLGSSVGIMIAHNEDVYKRQDIRKLLC